MVGGSAAHLKSKANAHSKAISQVVQRNIGEMFESQQLQFSLDPVLERVSRCA